MGIQGWGLSAPTWGVLEGTQCSRHHAAPPINQLQHTAGLRGEKVLLGSHCTHGMLLHNSWDFVEFFFGGDRLFFNAKKHLEKDFENQRD